MKIDDKVRDAYKIDFVLEYEFKQRNERKQKFIYRLVFINIILVVLAIIFHKFRIVLFVPFFSFISLIFIPIYVMIYPEPNCSKCGKCMIKWHKHLRGGEYAEIFVCDACQIQADSFIRNL